METSGELKIAHVLRRLLDREQVTLRQLSADLNIPLSTLFNYLVNRMPRNPLHIRKICAYFSITSDELLFDLALPASQKLRPGDVVRGAFRVVAIEAPFDFKDSRRSDHA